MKSQPTTMPRAAATSTHISQNCFVSLPMTQEHPRRGEVAGCGNLRPGRGWRRPQGRPPECRRDGTLASSLAGPTCCRTRAWAASTAGAVVTGCLWSPAKPTWVPGIWAQPGPPSCRSLQVRAKLIVTPARAVPTVLISIRWPASLCVTDIVPDTAPLMVRLRLDSVERPLTEPAALNVRSSH